MFSGSLPHPLEGVKVVELATFIAVPAAGRHFADLGADVVKVEPPSGDVMRWLAANIGIPDDPLENTNFDLENGGKRSIALDLDTPEGMQVLDKLIEGADVFLTNWRPKALARRGLDYESLHARHPKLVYGCLTGYGDEGPDKDLPGFDSTAFFARSGYLGMLTDVGSHPMNVVPGLGDHTAAYMLSSGVLGAYINVLKGADGDRVSVNLLHAAIYTQGLMVQAAQYKELGSPYPIDHSASDMPLVNSFVTSDGRLIYLAANAHNLQYPAVMRAIGKDDLADDPVFKTQSEMIAAGRSAELYAIVAEQIRAKPLSHWIEAFTSADLPCSALQTWEEVLADEQAWANGVFYRCEHENGNAPIVVRTPVNFDHAPAPSQACSPTLGKDSVQIVRTLGYTPEETERLLESGVIRA